VGSPILLSADGDSQVAGAAVINVAVTAPNSTIKHFSWDDHAGVLHPEHGQREWLPQMDQGLTVLIEDLCHCGLDWNVMVIAFGEFYHTFQVTHSLKKFSNRIRLGRGHWPNTFIALNSGGGSEWGRSWDRRIRNLSTR